MRAGLIPSRSLQEKRILLARTNDLESNGEKGNFQTLFEALFHEFLIFLFALYADFMYSEIITFFLLLFVAF